jgi:hypothetical protein
MGGKQPFASGQNRTFGWCPTNPPSEAAPIEPDQMIITVSSGVTSNPAQLHTSRAGAIENSVSFQTQLFVG